MSDLSLLQERDAEVDRTPLIGGIMGALFLGFIVYAFVAYGGAPKVAANNGGTSQSFSGKRADGIKDVYAGRFQQSAPAFGGAPRRVAMNESRPQQSPPVAVQQAPRVSLPNNGATSFPSPTKSAADHGPRDDTAGYIETASVSLVNDDQGTSCFGNVTVMNSAGTHLRFKIYLMVDGARYELVPFEGSKDNPRAMRSFELNVGQGQNVSVMARGLQNHSNITRMSVILESYSNSKLTGADELIIK